MKIKTKLVVGFSALLLIILSLSLVSYERMSYMNDQIDRVYQDRYMKVRYSSGMRGEVNGIATELANQLLDGRQSNLSESRLFIENAKERTERFWDSINSEKGSAEERRLVQNVGTSWDNFSAYETNLMQLLENGDLDQAQAYRDSTGIELQRTALGALNELASYQDLQVEAEVANVKAAYERSTQITTIFLLVGLLLGLGIMMWVIPSVTRGLNTVSMMISSFGKGKLKAIRRIKVKSTDEIGSVAKVFQAMAEDIEEKQQLEREYMEAQNDRAWINSNMARITDVLKGIMSLNKVSQTFVSEFTPILGAEYGALYLVDLKNPNQLNLSGSYAFSSAPETKPTFQIGEGLLGQSAADRRTILLEDVPQQYIEIGSALGESPSTQIMIHPVVAEDELIGVFEIASLTPFSSLQRQLLDQLLSNLGVILNNINGRLRVEELLRESQALTEELQCQSEELQTQQEELKRSNENLESQAEALRRSEDLLQRQQEELEHFNTELIAKTRALEEQVHETEEKNREVELARVQLERQTMQLAVSSKYKSEFLANMSHELRTPLNSLLILSQLLAENKEGNLAPKQVEYAQTIYMSGGDLLKMIDEILDLSKVDAGKMELNREPVPIDEITTFVTNNFGAVAEKKGISLNVEVNEDELPSALLTDGHRLKQVLRNLLSNAFKFTSDGSVTFRVCEAQPEELPDYLEKKRKFIEFSVIDTGIGIPQDKTDIVFEAFQQVDGTTSRKYGGTGLGLSISRELAKLLGGAIELESEEGSGSRFSLYIPKLTAYASGEESAAKETAAPQPRSEERVFSRKSKPASVEPIAPKPQLTEIEDDRDSLAPEDKVLLIIEDDPKFAVILRDMARSYGYKAMVEVQGDTGLETARSRMPDAIILDIQLPVIDGWTILSELKSSSETRHIPVHVVSVVDDVKQGLMMGAIAYLKKPANKEGLERAFSYIGSYADKSLKHLLIVEDDEVQRGAIIELIGHDDVAIKAVGTGSQALEELQRHHYDCMVLDLMLSDMTGFEMLDRIREDERLRDLPIIIYTGKDLDSKEETKLRQYAESIIVKDVKSPERLLDETTLFLHRVEADLPEDKRKILQKLHNKETLFEGKKILLVDDDVRNVFALSSVLESYRMDVTFAENGREAVELLEQRRDEFDLILMDMMMPEMDGYEAMRLIRQMPGLERIPIIALTAKAMKEDRGKCIEAGASDYVKKPIQTEQLLSLMRVWLYS